MKKIFNKVLIAFAAGSISLATLTSLTRPTSHCCSVHQQHNIVIW